MLNLSSERCPVSSQALKSSATVSWSGSKLRVVTEISVVVLLTAVAAQIQVRVPGLVVPFTLQSLVVLSAAFLLSPLRALAAMAVYLVVGSALIGLGSRWSVFTPGSLGLAGATGGYLIGFLVAAPLTSWLSGSHARTVVRLLLAGLAGTVVIFAFGVAWLSMFSGGLKAAASAGVIPFVPESLIKLVAAVGVGKTMEYVRRSVPGRMRSGDQVS